MVIARTGDQRRCKPNCSTGLTNLATDRRHQDRVFGRPRVGAQTERKGRGADRGSVDLCSGVGADRGADDGDDSAGGDHEHRRCDRKTTAGSGQVDRRRRQFRNPDTWPSRRRLRAGERRRDRRDPALAGVLRFAERESVGAQRSARGANPVDPAFLIRQSVAVGALGGVRRCVRCLRRRAGVLRPGTPPGSTRPEGQQLTPALRLAGQIELVAVALAHNLNLSCDLCTIPNIRPSRGPGRSKGNAWKQTSRRS
jgi:hypothetical protein